VEFLWFVCGFVVFFVDLLWMFVDVLWNCVDVCVDFCWFFCVSGMFVCFFVDFVFVEFVCLLVVFCGLFVGVCVFFVCGFVTVL